VALVPSRQEHRYGVSPHPLTLFRGEMDDLFERFFGEPLPLPRAIVAAASAAPG
jgi:hypothetical protein